MTTDRAPASDGVRRLGHDYASILAGQAAGLGLGVAGVALSTHLLGTEGAGRVALFLSALQLLYVLGVHWLMAAVIRFGREGLVLTGRAGHIIAPWLLLVAAAVGLSAAVASAAGAALIRLLIAPPQLPLLLVALVTLAGAKVMEHLLQTTGQMGGAALGRPLGKLFVCAALLAFALGPGVASVDQVLLVTVGGFALHALGVLPVLDRSRLLPLRWDAAMARSILLYSLPLWARGASSYVLDWVDVFCLRLFRTTAEVGVYHVAYQWMQVVTELLAGLTMLVFPILVASRARGSREALEIYVERLVPQLSALWCVFLLGVAVASRLVIPWMLPPAFGDVERLLGLLLVAAAFQVVTYAYLPVLQSHDLMGPATAVLVPMALVNLAADLRLVPALGARGAALATAGTYALGAVLHLALAHRALDLRRRAALVPPLLMAPILLVHGFGLPTGAQVATALAGLLALGLWLRAGRVFQPSDAAILDWIALPPALRGLVARAYAALP
jgi:O-antigen/teichoic acid export membrane protein